MLVDDLGLGSGISSPVLRKNAAGCLEPSPAGFEAGK